MTQEEKAKAYDEALEQAKRWHKAFVMGHNYPATDIKVSYEIMFPELKESEDERIKREIITYLSTVEDKELIPYESWIAWLEKQGGHHIACSEEQMKILDEILNFAANHESPYWNNYIFETLNNLIRQLKN